VTFGDTLNDSGSDRRKMIERELASIRDQYRDEIEKRFPKILRSNGGYGLDRLGGVDTLIDVTKILCGSEGTLGVIVGAKLKLTPIPKYKGLVVLHFHDLLDAIGVTSEILKHHPAAIELVDHLIVEAGRSNPALRQRCDFLHCDPQALLIV
jgi:FAD/FMN-containing dehydrogenase